MKIKAKFLENEKVLVTSFNNKQSVKIPKIDFLNTFVKLKDDIWTLKKESEGKVQKMNDMINEAISISLMIFNEKNHMTMAYRIGKLSDKFCKEFNCSPADFIKIVAIRRKDFIERSTRLGVKFGTKYKPKQNKKEDIKIYKRDGNSFVEVPIVVENITCSIGDILEGKKKNKRNKKEL